jgi:hypothetical protein
MSLTPFRTALLAAACLAGLAQAQSVTPPPLPPGSHLVRPEPGMDESERKRHVRAHHHKFHHKKDVTRDDSVHGHESLVQTSVPAGAGGGAASGAGAAAAAGRGGPAAIGGAGTGPRREQTDKGASSYFHGEDPKTKTK